MKNGNYLLLNIVTSFIYRELRFKSSSSSLHFSATLAKSSAKSFILRHCALVMRAAPIPSLILPPCHRQYIVTPPSTIRPQTSALSSDTTFHQTVGFSSCIFPFVFAIFFHRYQEYYPQNLHQLVSQPSQH